MPTDWNGSFYMVGNGGKAGTISFSAMPTGLRMGYAASSTDTGHNSADHGPGANFGNASLFPTAYGDVTEMEIDFGWRAIHYTALASKDIIKSFYGKKPNYSYWVGASTGGRQGLMEAQRFPKDFDGYLVGYPVRNYMGQQMSAPAYLRPLYPDGIPGPPIISPELIAKIGDVIYNGLPGYFDGCDELDGVNDELLRDPRQCGFDPEIHIPRCPEEVDGVCLTENQAAALKEVYAGKPPLVPPEILGGENIPGGWSQWLIPSSGGVPLLNNIMVDAFNWLTFDPDRPTFKYLTDFNWDTDPPLMEPARKIYDATDPDLRDLKAQGSKIIMYHGWGDVSANPLNTVEYYESVIAFMTQYYGPKWKAEENTKSFFKLYMVPGMPHGTNNTSHSRVDWFTHLKDWVENGIEPGAILGLRQSDGTYRPHCPYPEVAIFIGSDINDPSHYTCGIP
jgi:feruloyl esterase